MITVLSIYHKIDIFLCRKDRQIASHFTDFGHCFTICLNWPTCFNWFTAKMDIPSPPVTSTWLTFCHFLCAMTSSLSDAKPNELLFKPSPIQNSSCLDRYMKCAKTSSLHTVSTGGNLATRPGAQNSNGHWQLQLDWFKCRCEAGALITKFVFLNVCFWSRISVFIIQQVYLQYGKNSQFRFMTKSFSASSFYLCLTWKDLK